MNAGIGNALHVEYQERAVLRPWSVSMFDNVVAYLDRLATDGEARFDARETRAAIAALLCHVAMADGAVNGDESRQLRQIMQQRFGEDVGPDGKNIDEQLSEEIAASARRRAIFPYTTIINRSCTPQERKIIFNELCEVGFADGKLDANEHGVLIHLAGLLKLDAIG